VGIVVTPAQAFRFIERHGVVLESARHPAVPNLADAVLGRNRRGSWWGHPHGKAFFGLTRRVRASGDVLVCRLVGGKVTYVHRRLWPAMARLARAIGVDRLASIREVHATSGPHHVYRTPMRRWLPVSVRTEAAALTMTEARHLVGPKLWPAVLASPRRAS
jgi:hypothetical protein